MSQWKRAGICLVVLFALLLTACGGSPGGAPVPAGSPAGTQTPAETPAMAPATASAAPAPTPSPSPAETPAPAETAEPEPPEKNGEVYVLFTGDIHCGVDQGFGFVGLQQVRDTLEARGYETLLVDCGDAIQGEAIGMLTKGESIIGLMNALGYDAATPGNHEFDYGTDRFLELAEMADFPYVCCNLTYLDEPVFPGYTILEAAGLRIAFVGVTTPRTTVTANPRYFRNEAGELVYGFLQDETGEKVWTAVQAAADAARAEGADLVYVLGHLGLNAADSPWTYADVIAHTTGIDVLLDGHTHDSEQVTMLNAEGKSVVRSASGTKLRSIGYSHISAEGKILETGIWSWPNGVGPAELLGLENSMSGPVAAAAEKKQELLGAVLAGSGVTLTVNDPLEVYSDGRPVRMVRRAETNLGDFAADAFRIVTGADVGLLGGGGIRADLRQGEITGLDLINILPFGNTACMIRATGQQILDALEWGAHAVPGEFGGFLQVSGLSYEILVSVPSPCTADENSMLAGISGERRVRNVRIGDAPLDPDGYYTVAGTNYVLTDRGDGLTAFVGAEVVQEQIMTDYEVLYTYLTDVLGGEIGEAYADPCGQGRITVIE